VLNLSHPDLHWFIPVPRPKATDPGKQVEEIEGAIADAIEERRKDPIYGPPDGLASHFVSTARLLIRRAALRPVEGRGKVFLVGHAERLVPQESSPEAANALLKALEEPGEDTWFILTAEDLEEVLPTIRSRAVRLRLSPLRDEQVAAFLARHRPDWPAGKTQAAIAGAAGAPGKAVVENEQGGRNREFARAWLAAVRKREPAAWELALKQMPFSARGEFTATLDALAEELHDQARQQVTGGQGAEGLLRAVDRIGEAREMAQGNVNPQLILAGLSQELAGTL